MLLLNLILGLATLVGHWAGVATEPVAQRDHAQAPQADLKPTRVAILNFGPPSTWHGRVGSLVGVQILAADWSGALPLLEEDGVEVVVVRVNSEGGYLGELQNFHAVFEQQYKRKFRTAVWIDTALGAAAMAVWPIEEFFMTPEGRIGECTPLRRLQGAIRDPDLEAELEMMQLASRRGKHAGEVMRAMQLMQPFSADIAPDGAVIWREDLNGALLLSSGKLPLVLGASDAVKTGVVRASASERDTIVRAMGLDKVAWAGSRAATLINESMIARQRDTNRVRELQTQFGADVARLEKEFVADREERLATIADANDCLEDMKLRVKRNPVLAEHLGLREDWFDARTKWILRLSHK